MVNILIVVSITIVTLAIIIVVYLILYKRKKGVDPLLARIEGLIVILNQRIHNTLLKTSNLDREVTALFHKKEALIEKENEGYDSETIDKEINAKKTEIEKLIARVEEMKEYKEELEQILKERKIESEEKITKLVDQISEKIRYYY